MKLLLIALLFTITATAQPDTCRRDTTLINRLYELNAEKQRAVDKLFTENQRLQKELKHRKTTGFIAYFVAVAAGFIAIIK